MVILHPSEQLVCTTRPYFKKHLILLSRVHLPLQDPNKASPFSTSHQRYVAKLLTCRKFSRYPRGAVIFCTNSFLLRTAGQTLYYHSNPSPHTPYFNFTRPFVHSRSTSYPPAFRVHSTQLYKSHCMPLSRLGHSTHIFWQQHRIAWSPHSRPALAALLKHLPYKTTFPLVSALHFCSKRFSQISTPLFSASIHTFPTLRSPSLAVSHLSTHSAQSL